MIRLAIALFLAFFLAATPATAVFAQDSSYNASPLLYPFYSGACVDSGSDSVTTSTTPTTTPATTNFLETSEKIDHFEGETITPKAIILHWTGGEYASPQALIGTLESRTEPLGGYDYSEGRSVQLAIDKDGKVAQLSKTLETRPRQSMTDQGWNDVSIGIEIESGSFKDAAGKDDFPAYENDLMQNNTQFTTVLGVVRELMSKYNIKNEANFEQKSGIFGHLETNPGNMDPGANFMKKVRDSLDTNSTPSTPQVPQGVEPGCVCSPDSLNQNAQPSGEVYIVGDSIIDWFANADEEKAAQYGVEPRILEKKLSGAGWKANIQAKGGRQLRGSHYNVTPDGIGQIEQDLDAIKNADSIVISLGTNRNDPWQENTKDNFRQDIETVVSKIKEQNKNKENAKIFWVNIAHVGDTLDTDPPGGYAYQDSLTEYNQVISEAAEQLKFEVIDWSGTVAANQALIGTDYGELDGYAHVHPSPAGAESFAQAIASAIGSPSVSNQPSGSQERVQTADFNPDPAAVEQFNKDLLPKITPLIPLYQEAAKLENMHDWEVLPALHNLEYSLRKSNPTGNLSYASPFQMRKEYMPALTGDGPPDLPAANGGDPLFAPGKELSDEEFVKAARYAIRYMRGNASYLKLGDLSQPLTAENAGKLMVSYKSGAGSVWFKGSTDFNLHAYTWAGYDTTPEHKLPMDWGPGSPNRDEQPGRLVKVPGSAVVFMLLKGGVVGVAGDPSCTGGALTGDLSEPDYAENPNVKVDGSPPGGHKASNCTGTFTPGAASLKEVIMERWSPPVTSIGGYACRSIVGSASTSIHGLGRAIDVMVDSTTPEGLAKGDEIRNWVINNSTNLGVQRVIWNRKTWAANQAGWRDYGGPNPHTDHLHIEVNLASSTNPNLGR